MVEREHSSSTKTARVQFRRSAASDREPVGRHTTPLQTQSKFKRFLRHRSSPLVRQNFPSLNLNERVFSQFSRTSGSSAASALWRRSVETHQLRQKLPFSRWALITSKLTSSGYTGFGAFEDSLQKSTSYFNTPLSKRNKFTELHVARLNVKEKQGCIFKLFADCISDKYSLY